MKKTWRDEMSDEDKAKINYGQWNFGTEDWMPITDDIYDRTWFLRVLDIKEYDPILNERNLVSAKAYEYFEGDLNEVEKNVNRNERLSPELNINEVLMLDGKYMLIQERTYRVYFDFIFPLPPGRNVGLFDIIPTAKALNYGFNMQSPIAIQEYYNPVIPFFDNTYGYIISTNMYTPVTVNIPKGTKLGYLKLKV